VALELESPILDCNAHGMFAINLDNPKPLIMKSFENQLNRYIKEYQKTEHSKDTPATRARLKLYDVYLRIYDHREKGWSWSRLANRFFKHIEDRNYAIRKVKREYQQCRKLIEEGYRHIR